MEKLRALLEYHSVDNIDKKIEIFEEYRDRLLAWNNKVNLTAITNCSEFEKKHYIDSLACIDSPELAGAERVLDLGSGGGFPGVPLAIVFPEKEFLLLDSSAKRMKIVGELARELGLTNVETLHGRAEEMAREAGLRETFHLCVSRAVAPFATLLEYCLPFVRCGGTFIAYKGPGSEEEIDESGNAAAILGGRIDRTEQAEFPFLENGYSENHKLVYVSKEEPTPDKYPRNVGKPTKKPLK